jgi:hypothetical protein
VLQVQPHIVRGDVKKLGHLALREPDGLILGAELDLTVPVFGGVEN